MSLLIKSGRILDPTDNTDTIGDLLIENGKIVADAEGDRSDELTIDADCLLVVPGLIDMHVRSPLSNRSKASEFRIWSNSNWPAHHT